MTLVSEKAVRVRGRLPEEPEIPSHVPPALVMEPLDWEDTNSLIDPFSITERVIEELPPIFYSPRPRPGTCGAPWILTRYDDIRRAYENGEYYSNRDSAAFHRLLGETFLLIPGNIDQPKHSKYRLFLNPRFSPRAMAQMEGAILESISHLIDDFIEKGHCDAAYDFGRVYPVVVFLDFMGFPRSMLDEFLSWAYAILHSYGDIERIQWGMGSAIRYLRNYIPDLRDKPEDNTLGSYIVHGKIDGVPLTEDEIMGMMTFLWLGGLDTVAATTSLMLRRLALQPDLQQRLRDNPDLINPAVEEFLRTQPLVSSGRLVIKDHEICGQLVKAGDSVLCANNVGNFDPQIFESPRTFAPERANNRHFTFGGGPHLCLGIHLARLELRTALREFLRRVPFFKLAPGVACDAMPGLIAAPHVPILWDAR
ncbi:MAG: cytochrome P450 [Spongiibacteraceae bacterium]